MDRDHAWLRASNAWWLALAVSCGAMACDGDQCRLDATKCVGSEVWTCVEDDCHTFGCSTGTYWSSEPCPAVCVTNAANDALCALSEQPDPSCEGDGVWRCDEDALVRCDSGYAVERFDCRENGDVCVSSQERSLCAASSMPDPRCEGTDISYEQVCDGSTFVLCSAGYLVSSQECARGCAPDPSGVDPDGDAGAPGAPITSPSL